MYKLQRRQHSELACLVVFLELFLYPKAVDTNFQAVLHLNLLSVQQS